MEHSSAPAPAKGERLVHPLRFALGMLGITIPGQMYSAYASFFYNDKMGLPLTMISLGMVFYSIWDAINDPLLGYLSDRTRTRYGRRKPWLLVAAPLFALFFILFFSPPGNLGIPTLTVYFTIMLMLTETMGTVTATNYHSLFPELFKGRDERASANALRQAMQLVGMIIGVSLTPVLTDVLGYPHTAILLGLLGMGLLVFCTLGCREDPAHSTEETPGLIDSFRAVLSNRNFWLVSGTNFFYQATVGLALAAIPFFIKYALGLPDIYATILSGVVFVLAIPAMAGWAALIRRHGTLHVWRWALILLGIAFIPMFFASNIVMSIIGGALIGLGISGVTANIDLINAKIIDKDREISGLAREGIYHSTINFVVRFSGLMRSLVFLLVSVWFGFVDSANPGHNPGMAARFMMSLFPVVFMLFSAVISRFVRFEDEI